MKMAWFCQLCNSSSYAFLSDLVGHIRAVHTSEIFELVCQVNGCPQIFHKTNTWYKHVRKQHLEEYKKGPTTPSGDDDNDDTEGIVSTAIYGIIIFNDLRNHFL